MSDTIYKSLDFMGFPFHRIGDDGLLWKLKRGAWHQVVRGPQANGYFRLTLRHQGVKITIGYHQLVLLAFVGPCPEGMMARHYPDRTKTNNALTNLSWATPLQNMLDKIEHGTMTRGEDVNTCKLTEAEVVTIREMYATRMHSLASLGRQFGVSYVQVRHIVTGQMWKHLAGPVTKTEKRNKFGQLV